MTKTELRVQISASLALSNGTRVAIEQREIVLTKPGPRGGTTSEIRIPRGEWPAIAAAVEQVQLALEHAERMKKEIEGAQ